MRFSDTIRCNANPQWWHYYIPYEDLKKIVDRLRYIKNVQFVKGNDLTAPFVVAPNGTRQGDESSDEERDHDDSLRQTNRNEPRDPHDVEHPRPFQQTNGPSTLTRTASERVLLDMNHAEKTSRAQRHAQGGHAQGEHDDDDFIPMPTINTPADAASEFALEEARFFRKVRARSKRADSFYIRLCQELRSTADEKRKKAEQFMHRVESLTAEGTPLLVQPYYDTSPHNLPSPQEMDFLRREYLSLYREIAEAINFSTINVSGFRKILKKHDKVTGLNTKSSFMAELMQSTEFHSTLRLEELQAETAHTFSALFRDGKMDLGKLELDNELRDLIFWERSNVWRDLLRDEKKQGAVRTVRGGSNFREAQEKPAKFLVNLWVVALAIFFCTAISLYPSILRFIVGPEQSDQTPIELFNAANRCFALLMLAVTLWAGVGIPLYATSFIVLAGSVVGSVFIGVDGYPLNSHLASDEVFRHLGSSTLLLILCVYSLASALSKYEIDKQIATTILSYLNPRADFVLFSLMCLSVVVSIFVSNVAAPVLLNSVMKPTFDIMQLSQANRKYVQCLLFGVMVACNIGGFASPIASPQSAVALGLLTGNNKIKFMTWIYVALPLCFAMVLAFFIVLRIMFEPQNFKIPSLHATRVVYRWWHWAVVLTLVGTIFLWVIHWFSDVFGSAGMVAAVPLVLIFGVGILNKMDFNSLPWDVVMLVAGGSVLGAAVESSKLLDLISHRLLAIGGATAWSTFIVLCSVVAVLASFVSHTVSAIILLPLFLKIGEQLGHPQMFVLGGTIASSCAMATNVSSFPNISASEMSDEHGETYIKSEMILRIGTIMTGVALLLLVTLGYVLMGSLVT